MYFVFIVSLNRKSLSEATNVAGITEPYAYYGYPKSCFPLHREDLDLCSVNYLHQGKPK